MVRQRMTALDIKAVVEELRASIVGMRLQNVYDLSPRVFLLKFAQSDRKVHVLIESGVRIHTTSFTREKPKVPSQFTLKLRKHVRSWRLDAIDQLGFDRAVDFRFGTGEGCHHFVIEFHSKGNFILTDHSYNILMLLRTHKDNDVDVRVREQYPLRRIAEFHPCSEESLTKALDEAKPTDMLRTAVCNCGSYGTTVVDHVLLSMGLKPTEKKTEWCDRIAELVKMLFGAIAATNSWFTQPLRPGGFLLAAPSGLNSKPPAAASSSGTAEPPSHGNFPMQPPLPQVYLDFTPVMLKQFDSVEYVMSHESSFCTAAEKFFLPSELDRIETHNVKKETTALSKRDKCLRDHQRRIEKLKTEEDNNRHKAQLLQFHADEVQEAIDLIRMVLATGISWSELKRVLRERQREGHPVANIIHELNLERNTITVLLVDPQFNDEYEAAEEDEDGEEWQQDDESAVVPVSVEVDLGISAQANAGRFYDTKKANARKLEKTVMATDKALAGAERRGTKVAEKKGPSKKEILATRSPVWFEKFYWFLTSFGHIVVAARDPVQGDVLVKRYMKPGDIFVHSDANGALPCVVKNPDHKAIAMGSLEEAGTLAVCRSKAWDSKMSMSAWWCYASQVSKRLSNGDFLDAGLFSIRGKKNFLPAMPLQLGCALLFRTEDVQPSVVAASGVNEDLSPDSSPVEYIPAEDPSPVVTPSPLPSATHTPKFPSQASSGTTTPLVGGLLSSGDRETSDTFNISGEDNDAAASSVSPSATGSSNAGRKKLSAKERLLSGGRSSRSTASTADSGKGGADSASDVSGGAGRQPAPHSPMGGDSSDTISFPSEPPSGSGVNRPSKGGHQRLQKLQDDLMNQLEQDDSNDADESSMAPSSHHPKKGKGGPGAGQPGIGLPKSRRQLNKLKKIKKKYSEQDEEDRIAAMALIGNKASTLHAHVSPTAPPPSALKQARGASEGEDSGEATGSRGDTPEPSSTRLDSKSKGVKFAEGEKPASPTSSPTARAQVQPPGELPVVDADHEMMRQRSNQAEGDEERIAERVLLELRSEVPHLTGRITAADASTVLYCYAVVAPYSSLITYSYKVKLTPGHEKRGNAAKATMHSFGQQIAAAVQHHTGATPPATPHSTTSTASSSTGTTSSSSELKQVFQRLPVEDVTQQFLANVKVHPPIIQQPRNRPARGVAAAAATTTANSSSICAGATDATQQETRRPRHVNPVA